MKVRAGADLTNESGKPIYPAEPAHPAARVGRPGNLRGSARGLWVFCGAARRGGERMARPEKPVARWQPGHWGQALVLSILSLGCSAPRAETRRLEQVAPSGPLAPSAETTASGSAPIQVTAGRESDRPSPNALTANGDDKGENRQPKQKITLPMAVEMCVNYNFRVLAGAERVRMAEADLVTSSLIPNSALSADYQLIPLQHVDVNNQLGPPQWDAQVSVPIDWLLFGKRLAAVRAARLGVEVSSADYANVFRLQVAQTVDAFYEVLTDDAYFKLAERHLEQLTDLEKLTKDLAKNKKVGDAEVDRMKLAVHEAVLERHDRELALELAKARLRPFLGHTAADADFEVEGALSVAAVVPPPSLGEAVALAEAHRPDLLSGRKGIEHATVVVDLERRRAKPQVALQPGWSYQNQRYVNGFRNGSMLDVGVSTTLPLTDRNQGNIRKAQAYLRERQFTYHADRADALADVEAAAASYADAVEHLTQFNTPETLKAARDLRKYMEAAYRAGDRKLIELLDAQKAYRDRLGHVIEFESDYWRALNKLNAAVGLKAFDPEKGPTQPFGKEDHK
jgi:outer membrane protein, heavy metal efflux system